MKILIPKGHPVKDGNFLKANNARSLWHPMGIPRTV